MAYFVLTSPPNSDNTHDMDVKDSLKTILEALHELKKQQIDRQCLIDFVRGNESKAITEKGLDSLELFGSGDKREDTHYNLVIDQALDEKILKSSSEGLTITAKGERFRKSPTAFLLKEENDEEEPGENDNALLDSLVENALSDKDEEEDDTTIAMPSSTARSQQMIHLIQAIDRKIPLDDYAEQMQLGFDEVLDSLDHLVERGTKFDITYFVDEVMEKECQEELLDYFDEVNGNLEKAFDEFYGVYRPEEIRLVRLIWKP